MTLTTTGQPNYKPNAYYLAPAMQSQTVVAYTALTDTPMALISYADVIELSLRGSSVTINARQSLQSCGHDRREPGRHRLSDLRNGDVQSIRNGCEHSRGCRQCLLHLHRQHEAFNAYFLDQCDSHSNGSTWHAHGNPDCVTSQVDQRGSFAHHWYRARWLPDLRRPRHQRQHHRRVAIGRVQWHRQCDPGVSRRGVSLRVADWANTKNALMNCYSGTVSQAAMTAASKLACNMKTMLAMMKQAQTSAAVAENRSAGTRVTVSKPRSGSLWNGHRSYKQSLIG